MPKLNFMVCKDELLAGTKERTMRPVTLKTWQKAYARFQKYYYYEDFKDLGNVAIPKIKYTEPLSIYWSLESPCPACHEYTNWKPNKGTHQCNHCKALVELPPKMFRPKRKLFDAVLTNITKRTLGSLSEDEWRADGFKSLPSTEDCPYPTPAKYTGLQWFADQYHLEFDWENNGPSQQLLEFKVFIIEFRRI